MKKLNFYFLASALAFLGLSCSSEDDNPAPEPGEKNPWQNMWSLRRRSH